MRVWRMPTYHNRRHRSRPPGPDGPKALTAIVTDRSSPQKRVWRAQIVLLTADGSGTMGLTCRTGTSKTAV
jgi:hypothetical protein